MNNGKTVNDCETLALLAMAHIAGDADLGPRFFDLTGMDSAGLRARAGERSVLAAVLEFLTQHEPDLIATAAALDVPPAALARAAHELGG